MSSTSSSSYLSSSPPPLSVASSAFRNALFGHPGGAMMAGVFEIAFFHPFDTIAKRLMSHRGPLHGDTTAATARNVSAVIFKQRATNSTFLSKAMCLYPGSVYAVFYKVLQRVYKFAGQPIVRQAIDESHWGQSAKKTFGRKGKMTTEAIAGCLVGMGEVILLPLDRLKILSQTNQAALKDRNVFRIITSEGRGLYAGTLITMCRNIPGSFCLFGGTAFTKDYVFHLKDYSQATFFQNICASTVGSVLSIVVSNPMDVLKTRIQNKAFGKKHLACSICQTMIKEEGTASFFKGLTPKVIVSAPKLVFAYTMTEYFYNKLKAIR